MTTHPVPSPAAELKTALAARYIRAKDGAVLCKCSLATWWRYASNPSFPAAIRISTRNTVWCMGEVTAWLNSRTGQSPKKVGGK